ncbi:hypothetical protein F443_09438 [Phytophthora nicotianae P1569]|nr:hypothetical protein F443_09438 [Phytophthora nicotianae P1569]
MDFTHGANNLGYHLGSLLEKNPGWCNIVSVVIDKDFVECSSETDYDTRYDALRRYCEEQKRRTIFTYFEKNWNSFRDR